MTNSADESIRLIVRADDMGMTHASNAAIAQCFNEGILTCAGIQAVGPWAEEACALGRENPNWCLGAHLTAIGEWQGYRWRPVLPYTEVPSLVDEHGFLPRTPEEFYAGNPDYGQLEREFRAQVELLVEKWGVDLGYVDTDYLDSVELHPEFTAVSLKIAEEFGVPRSGHAGEDPMGNIYGTEPALKVDTYAEILENLKPGTYMSLHHLLIDAPDSHALLHTEVANQMPAGVGTHRIAECTTLLSPRIRKIINRRGIELVSYRNI
ncbi:MAG: ChbG/HpnK family deacetylase [Candidatus Latescibacterota bacterium]|jgi:predicted glycoside hydrolase/deacetylase ChbG (UPF0249 family)